jgi:hypothetical protein
MSIWRALALSSGLLAVGCQPQPVGETAAELVQPTETGVDKYGLGWVEHDDGTDDCFVVRADLHINAPVDVVWSLVHDPNGYANFNQSLTAQIAKMEVGQPITLYIRLFGDGLPPTESPEKVAIFDEALHVASWDRDFGLDQVTHRPQLLEPEGTGTHYYTALQLPKSFGWLVVGTLGNNIKQAFEGFATGLRDQAQRLNGTP